MTDEDYEIISHKEIDRLKQEINKLKEAEFSGSANTIMNKLDKILEIFKEASLSMQNDSSADKKIEEIDEKLNNLLDQNQQIAEGVLAVADLINNATEKEEKSQIPKQAPMPHPGNIASNPELPPRMMSPMPLRPGPMPHPQMQEPFPEQRRSLNPPSFPRPGMPSLNPLESPGRSSMGGLPPLPPKPPKKGLFR